MKSSEEEDESIDSNNIGSRYQVVLVQKIKLLHIAFIIVLHPAWTQV